VKLRRVPRRVGLLCALAGADPVLDLETLDGPAAERMIEDGDLTSVQLTRGYIARIAPLNKRGPGLNAVTQLNNEALKDAAQLDKERADPGAHRPGGLRHRRRGPQPDRRDVRDRRERRGPAVADVGGTVPATLSLSLGAPASFGAFVPGAAKTYTAQTTANVISTAGDASLTVSAPTAATRCRSRCRFRSPRRRGPDRCPTPPRQSRSHRRSARPTRCGPGRTAEP
jgi:hypothetical protein